MNSPYPPLGVNTSGTIALQEYHITLIDAGCKSVFLHGHFRENLLLFASFPQAKAMERQESKPNLTWRSDPEYILSNPNKNVSSCQWDCWKRFNAAM